MPTIVPLYSGSSGNCTAVIYNGVVTLIDVGVSCKRTVEALKRLSFDISDVSAILLTHEHSDHTAGLEVFLKRRQVPVYGTAGTLEAVSETLNLPASVKLCETDSAERDLFGAGLYAFKTPHDSRDCCGYRFDFGSSSAAIATDIGHITEEITGAVTGCDAVLLEANYDDGMLQMGSYPPYLKKRIMSDHGHLSNFECADALCNFAEKGAKYIRLMHISAENNTPPLALTTCLSCLEGRGIEGLDISPARRYELSDPITL